MSNSMVVVFFMLYLTAYVGLNGTVVGILMCVAKLWDAVNDPMLATFVNNTKSRFGKFKPWICFGTLVNCICLVLMFMPIGVENQIISYIYYFLMYVLWGMSFTCVDVPFWSMIPSIANTTDERNEISSLSRTLAGFGGLLVGSGGAIVITKVVPNGSANKWAYFVIACMSCVIFMMFLSLTVIFNKERYPLPENDVKIREIFGIFKTNDQLSAYSMSYLFLKTAATIAIVQFIYLFVYDYDRLYFGLYIIFNVVACTGQGIIMIFYPLIVKKIPREKMFGFSYISAVIGLLGLFFVFFFLKGIGYEQGATEVISGKEFQTVFNIVIVSIAGSMLMISDGINNIGSTVMISDVVDYGEWKTGKRSDSVIFSVQTLLTKLAGAAATLILGAGISASGLPKMIQGINEAGEVVYSFSGAVTDEMLLILRVFMFLVPVPMVVIGYIYYKKKYKLFGEFYDRIKSELDKRHGR